MSAVHALLRCVALAVALLAIVAHAQDPGTSAVQNAARQWLGPADKLDGGTSWRTAGIKFRQAITAERWIESLAAVREPLGAVQQRAVRETTLSKSLPGLKDGEYATVVFQTAFANKAESSEILRLEREPDGAWRVIGYFIR